MITYTAEKCPCGHKACRSGNVRPLTYGQGVMSMEEAQEVAHRMNAYPRLVKALQQAQDALGTSGIEPDKRAGFEERAALLRDIGEAT